ncbi:hypothetical protein [Actinomadura napierensis]|uniref:GNAT family N-acetyltransferase n=1 Tax=Actinomadura napierensis TaxID=267854 RepID=A0ABP5LR84_9ACTN
MTVTVAAATPAHVPQLLTRLEEMDQFYGDTTDGSPEARAGQLRQALFGDPPAGYALAALDGDEVVGLASYSFLCPAVGSPAACTSKSCT